MIDIPGWVDKASWAVLGATGTVLLGLYRNKTKFLPYYVVHRRVGLTTNDAIFGNVKVMLGEAVVPNLWLTEIRLENVTLRDFEKLVVTLYTNDSRLLNTSARLEGSAEPLVMTEEMQAKLKTEPGTQPSEGQRALYWMRREFAIPVLNRGVTAIFQVMTSANIADGSPSVWLDMTHKGLRVKHFQRSGNFDVLGIKAAIVWGLAVSVPVVALLAWNYSGSAYAIVAAYVFGIASGFLGLICRWTVGKLRTFFAV